MQREPTATGKRSGTDGLETAARRQRILEHLQRRSDRMSEHELAARIAAGGTASDGDVSEEDVRDIHVALRHVDLPKADAAGLVSWDESSGTVEPADEADLSETEARQLIADGWDDADAVSRNGRRRAALAFLRESEGEVTLNDLAAEVAAHETDDDVAPSAGDVDEVGVALHHRHLPRFEAADLVEYDPTAGTVVYRGHDGSQQREGGTTPARPGPGESDGDRSR